MDKGQNMDRYSKRSIKPGNDTEDSEIGQTKKQKMDADYFENYGDIAIHEEMLRDKIRTNAYRMAILKNYKKFYGKTVLDVGAGTGILSLFCVQAGAKKVYAIEASQMAEQTRRIVKENEMDDRIEVINCKVEEAELSEKVDIIVSEWMGYNLLYESMLESILFARDKFLKKDGHMFPDKATLYLAPITDDEYTDRLCIWNDVEDFYKVSMKSMIPYARQCISKTVQIMCIPQEWVQSHGCQIFISNLKTISLSEIQTVQSNFEFKCFGHSTIHGFVTWFTVEFPANITLTTSPYTDETHWAQTVLHIRDPFSVEQDTTISGSITIKPNDGKPRFLDICLVHKKDEGDVKIDKFLMDEHLT
ncbi:protein arginine N-methyltransferase 6 [Patella vulgata]|uniref:protein arginine N-methyltransferase 6 n=1 Tax=Patella vulgata TaxID=6465 RepID=UPI00218065C5|nr:protein arginine N-methyltransferase 6 [Patella vulgata]